MRLLSFLFGCAFAAALLSTQSTPQASRADAPPVVRMIKFENPKPLTVDEIFQRFKDKGAKLSVERPYDPQDVAQAAQLLKGLLAERGQPDVPGGSLEGRNFSR
jgi:hypothetical protein